MSTTLDIAGALRYGFDRLTTRGGAILVGAYVLVQLLSQVGYQSLFVRLYADYLPEMYPGTFSSEDVRDGFPLAADLPLAVSAGLIALLLVAGMLLSIVAMRAAYADIDSVPTAAHTRRLGRTLVVAFVVSIAVFLAVAVGTVFFVVPGIFLAVSLAFAQVAVVVEDAGVVESLRRSWSLASGNRWHLFALGLVVGVLAGATGAAFGMVGIVSPLVGELVTAVVSGVLAFFGVAVLVGAYRQLADEPAAGTPGSPSIR